MTFIPEEVESRTCFKSATSEIRMTFLMDQEMLTITDTKTLGVQVVLKGGKTIAPAERAYRSKSKDRIKE